MLSEAQGVICEKTLQICYFYQYYVGPNFFQTHVKQITEEAFLQNRCPPPKD